MSVWERWLARRIPERSHRAVLLAVLLFGSVLSYLLISTFLLGMVEVKGASMEPSLEAGDTYVLHKWRVQFQKPKRGQIVAILDPMDDGLSVKRVVGLPLEDVAFREGRVYIDNEVLFEEYLSKSIHTFPYVDYPSVVQLGEDEYLVLGDNRPESLDGRIYGGIPRARILGVLNH